MRPPALSRGASCILPLCLGALLILGISCAGREKAIARRQFADRLESTFGLSFPCSVRCSPSHHGPTTGLLIGIEKDTLTWTWEGLGGRLDLVNNPPPGVKHVPGRWDVWVDSVTNYPPHLVHVGPQRTPLPVNSPAESVFIEALLYAIGSDSVRVPIDKDKIVVLQMRQWKAPPGRNLYLDYLYRHDSGPTAAVVVRALERQRRGLPAFPTSKERSERR